MLGIQSRQCLGRYLPKNNIYLITINNLNNVNNKNKYINNVQKRNLSVLMADLSTVTTILTTAATVLGGVGGIWAYKRVPRERQTTYTNNVLKTLQKPYVPVMQKLYGLAFHRGEWRDDFMRLVNSKMYQLYHGPSEFGKSVAITNSLIGRNGVVHLKLREAVDADVPSLFASSLGVFGKEVEGRIVHLRVVTKTLVEAIKEFKKKPIIIVEDIDSVKGTTDVLSPRASELAGSLVDMHNEGLISVVYTVSNIRAVSLLAKVSGHRTRLKALSFPAIADGDMIRQLSDYAFKVDSDVSTATRREFEFFKDRKNIKEGYQFVLKSKQEAEYVVKHLGSHMGDVTTCLLSIVEDGNDTRSAVDAVIKQSYAHISEALLGKSCGPVDRATYIATAHLLFEAFCTDWVDEVYWYTEVTTGAPKITSAALTKAVDRLVEEGLFSYVDPFSVRLQARRLRWAYSFIREFPTVSGIVQEAMEKLTDNTNNNNNDK